MGLEVHHAGDEGVRNGGNADVEGVHVLVEQAAVRGDLLLEGGGRPTVREAVGVCAAVGLFCCLHGLFRGGEEWICGDRGIVREARVVSHTTEEICVID